MQDDMLDDNEKADCHQRHTWIGPTFWSRVNYLNKYWMVCQESLYRRSWPPEKNSSSVIPDFSCIAKHVKFSTYPTRQIIIGYL